MKRFTLFAAVMLFVCMLVGTSLSYAQGGMRGRGRQMMEQMRYDTTKVETIEGVVVAVDTVKFQRGTRMSPWGNAAPISLLVNTGKDTVYVHLGPAWYLSKQNITIGKGDDITVTGSRVSSGRSPAVLAAQVKTQGKTVDLRKHDGTPLWSRHGQ